MNDVCAIPNVPEERMNRLWQIITRMGTFFHPRYIRDTFQCYEILEYDLGHLNSVRSNACIDQENKPIPWYTYPAIEYLNQFDFSGKTVFEYGCGNSSLYWGRIAKQVISVDDNQEWYNKIKNQIVAPNELHFTDNKDRYPAFIGRYDRKFDIIVIDGNMRFRCAQRAVENISRTGIIILDNSDWYTHTAEFLRTTGFLQIDMTGFGPINRYIWTTSIFISREADLRPIHALQPVGGIGSLKGIKPSDDYE